MLILCGAASALPSFPATINDFAWLAGHWKGKFGQADAEEIHTAPRAGNISTVFRLTRDGKVLVLELCVIADGKDGLELRVRHFGPELDAWEKTDPIVLKLTSYDGRRAVFENFVHTRPKRTVITRLSDNEQGVRTEIIGDDGATTIHELTLHRVATDE